MQQLSGQSKPAIPRVRSNRVLDCLAEMLINSGKAVNSVYVYRVDATYFIVDGQRMSHIQAARRLIKP